MVADLENEGIAIRERRARQSLWLSPSILSPFQHDGDISSSDEGIEELQKASVSHTIITHKE